MSGYVDNGDSKSTVSKPSLASLPSDIIFIIACLAYPNPAIKRHSSFYSHFLGLTRVCHSWRNVLLSYPAFWTKIEVPLRTTWFLEEVLRRSADYPLEVLVKLDRNQDFARNLDILFSHLHHIRKLNFQTTYQDLDVFQLLDNKPAPILSVFTIHSSPENHFPLTFNGGSVPENVFVNTAPNLEELKIISMTISHQMPILKTITRLHLSRVRGITSVHQLLDMLEAMSHLEALELHSLLDLSEVFDVQDLDDRSIQFPALKSLGLNLEPEILMAILNHTTLPSEIDWRIDCHNALTKPAIDIAPLLSFISKARNGTCLTLKITGRDLQMEFAQNPTDSCNMSLKMELSEADVCLDRLNSVFVNFGLSKVYFCDIVYPPRTSDAPGWLDKYETTFDPLFSLLHHLEKLAVACDDTNGLWYFLSGLLPEEESTTLPCPLLSDLKVGVVSTTGKSLIKLLTRRKKAGGSVLTNLCVEYNHYSGELRRLKPMFEELVENVEIAKLNLTVTDNITYMEMARGPGGMYERHMESRRTISYTKYRFDVDRSVI